MGRKANHWRKKYQQHIIQARLAPPGPHSFILVLDGLKPDFNVGKIFRTAHAMGVQEICLVGIPFFNPNPALGTLKATRTLEFPSMEPCLNMLRERGYTLYALDPKGEARLGFEKFPIKSAFLFGHEEFGLSFSLKHFGFVKTMVIPQFGVVESLNVSVAAGMVSFEYVRQHGLSGMNAGAT